MTAMISALRLPPDIVAVSENWLKESNKDSFQLNGYNSFHMVRSARIRGGVSLFVRNNINADICDNFSYVSPEIEICTVNLTLGKEKYKVAAVYRPRSKHEHVK